MLGGHEADKAHHAGRGWKAAHIPKFGRDRQRGEIANPAEAA